MPTVVHLRGQLTLRPRYSRSQSYSRHRQQNTVSCTRQKNIQKASRHALRSKSPDRDVLFSNGRAYQVHINMPENLHCTYLKRSYVTANCGIVPSCRLRGPVRSQVRRADSYRPDWRSGTGSCSRKKLSAAERLLPQQIDNIINVATMKRIGKWVECKW